MAYSELVKDFKRIRDYLREFFVYGFKNRVEYNAKSARGYDNERRRIESWLGDFMSFHRDASGKTVFLSKDAPSFSSRHNPNTVQSYTDLAEPGLQGRYSRLKKSLRSLER